MTYGKVDHPNYIDFLERSETFWQWKDWISSKTSSTTCIHILDTKEGKQNV